MTQPALAFEYLQVLFQGYEHEVFSALFLDSQHRVICFETLFRGTIDTASVQRLKDALGLVEVRVIDHIVVGHF